MVYLGLPIKNGGSFHGYVSHNQMVIPFSLPGSMKNPILGEFNTMPHHTDHHPERGKSRPTPGRVTWGSLEPPRRPKIIRIWRFGITEISRKYRGNITEISRKYHGNILEISWKYHEDIMGHGDTRFFSSFGCFLTDKHISSNYRS